MIGCVFCAIVNGTAPAEFVEHPGSSFTVAFRPLGPVVDGHVLFVPRGHFPDAAADPVATGHVMRAAAQYAQQQDRPFNLITSAGAEATQSIFHLHVHYVPRATDDGLMVPWGTLHGENPQDPHRCRRVVELERELAQAREPYGLRA